MKNRFDLRHNMMPSHLNGIIGSIENKLALTYEEYQLTDKQFLILRLLGESESSIKFGFSQKFLVQVSGMPKHQITRNLDILERRKFLVRTDDPHSRRCKNIILTNKGSEIAQTVSLKYNNVCKEVFSVLSDKDCSKLQKLLFKVRWPEREAQAE